MVFAFAYCFAVGFYGKENSTDVKLPVKTDHDTLREGYRYAFVACIQWSCMSQCNN